MPENFVLRGTILCLSLLFLNSMASGHCPKGSDIYIRPHPSGKNKPMIYNYTGFHGCDSKCELQIINNLVIATEIPENEGTSVTNMAEHLATMVCQTFGIEPKHLIWIEHYPERANGRNTQSLLTS